MLLERPSHAEEWLKGKQFKPSQARDKSRAAASLYHSMYGRLSDRAHPNVVSALYHTVPYGGRHELLFYGGWYAPKTAGLLLCEFLHVEIAFLRAFYAAYEPQLGRLGLLFGNTKPGLPEESNLSKQAGSATWREMFEFWEFVLGGIETDFQSLQDDQDRWRQDIWPKLIGAKPEDIG